MRVSMRVPRGVFERARSLVRNVKKKVKYKKIIKQKKVESGRAKENGIYMRRSQ